MMVDAGVKAVYRLDTRLKGRRWAWARQKMKKQKHTPVKITLMQRYPGNELEDYMNRAYAKMAKEPRSLSKGYPGGHHWNPKIGGTTNTQRSRKLRGAHRKFRCPKCNSARTAVAFAEGAGHSFRCKACDHQWDRSDAK
jgi:hypothetical protein